tara:strand:+ start:473 stop:763 length:291 start_codon:yes stop_codon:yes gene_type:complete
MGKGNALVQLGFEPLVDFRLYDNSDGNGEQMEWLSDQPQPSESEIAEGQAAWDSLAYSRKRKAEYPSIEECIHAILDDGLVALQEKRAAVKARYPK